MKYIFVDNNVFLDFISPISGEFYTAFTLFLEHKELKHSYYRYSNFPWFISESFFNEPTLTEYKNHFLYIDFPAFVKNDTLTWYFEYRENVSYLVEFYDNLYRSCKLGRINAPILETAIPAKVKFKLHYFTFFYNEFVNYFYHNFWEFFHRRERSPYKIWGLSFYQHILNDNFFWRATSYDYSNPRVNLESSIYHYVWQSHHRKNTHYDLVFPYYVDLVWIVLNSHIFWFSNEYYLPGCFKNNGIFFYNTSLILLNSFWYKLLLFEYNYLDFSKKFIFWFFFCFLFFNYKLYLVLVFFFFLLFCEIYKFSFLKVAYFDKFSECLKFIYCFLIKYPKLLFISFISLILSFIHIIIEQFYWFYYVSSFWAYYHHWMLYEIRVRFLQYYIRFAIMYFFKFIYLSFCIFKKTIIASNRCISYMGDGVLFYFVMLNFFYEIFILISFNFIKKLWNYYLKFEVHKHLFKHTDLIFKFWSIFDKHLKVYHRYYKFKQYDNKYYKFFSFFAPYYRKGIKNKYVYNYNLNLSLLSFIINIIFIVSFVFLKFIIKIFVIFFVKFSWYSVWFLKICIYLQTILLSLSSKIFFGSIFSFFYNFFNIFIKCLSYISVILFAYLKYNIGFFFKEFKNFFFYGLKFICCFINIVFFNFLFFVLNYIPIFFFFCIRFLINYRILLFVIFLFFIFYFRIIVYFFIYFVTLLTTHYLPIETIWSFQYDIINPDVSLYNFDIFHIRLGDLTVFGWEKMCSRYQLLYNRVCARWLDYGWKKRWKTRKKFIFCYRSKHFYSLLSHFVRSDALYVFIVYYYYGLIYYFFVVIKRIIFFIIWWIYLVRYIIIPGVLNYFFHGFVKFIFYCLFFILKMILKLISMLLFTSFIYLYHHFIWHIIYNNYYEYYYYFKYLFKLKTIYWYCKDCFSHCYNIIYHKIFSEFSKYIYQIFYLAEVDKLSYYFSYKVIILCWYLNLILYDLFNIEFLKMFFFDFFKYMLMSALFIWIFIESIYYYYSVYFFTNFIDNTYLYNLIVSTSYWYYQSLVDYVQSMNIIIFFHFCWKSYQYYIDIIAFNIEYSRLSLYEEVGWDHKKHKFPVRRRKQYPRAKIFLYYRYAILDFFTILKTLEISTYDMFFGCEVNMPRVFFRYLYYNFFIYFYLFGMFMLFFLVKGFHKTLFFDRGYFGNADYLWRLFRNKKLEEVEWVFKKLNEIAKKTRSMNMSGMYGELEKEDLEFFQQVKSFYKKYYVSLEQNQKVNLVKWQERFRWDKDFEDKWWKHESFKVFRQGKVDFLEFFNSPNYKLYYESAAKNYVALGMLISYAFDKDPILRRLYLYEIDGEPLEDFFLKEYLRKKSLQDFLKNYFYALDEELYKYKLPYWIYHKDFFAYQLIEYDTYTYEGDKKVKKKQYQIIFDVESVFYGAFVWFIFLPYVLMRITFYKKYNFKRYKANWANQWWTYRAILSHLLYFYIPLLEKVFWSHWYAVGERKFRTVYSAPNRKRYRVCLPQYKHYFMHYYEGAYLKWIAKNHMTWSRIWFFTKQYKFYGLTMFNSNFYFYFSCMYLYVFIYCLISYKTKRILILKSKDDLIFFTRRFLIFIWKLEVFIKLKNRIRWFILEK